MNLNISILSWDQLEHWWKYYIYLRYVKSYKDGFIQDYKGPYFSKEVIDDIYHKFSDKVTDVIENTAKWLIQNIITSSISITYDKTSMSYYVDNEEDKESVERFLIPFPSYEKILKSDLLKLYQELDDTYIYQEWDELDNNSPIELLYQKIVKLAKRIESWQLINYSSMFHEYVWAFIRYYESNNTIDLQILAEKISNLTDSFDELLSEYWEHPHSFMYNELLKLSQSVDWIDISSSKLWENVSLLYNNIIDLWNSLSIELRKKIIQWENKKDDLEIESSWNEEDLSDVILDKLSQIINDFFSTAPMKVKWHQTIKDIFDAFDFMYFSDKYLWENSVINMESWDQEIDIDDLHNNFDSYKKILSELSLEKLENIKTQLLEKEYYELINKINNTINFSSTQ